METARKARIAYNGAALSNGEMDVRELAPALLAFSDLVGNAHRVLGGKQKIRVLLTQDSIRQGSFDLTLLLDMNLLEQAQALVGFGEETGLSDLMTVLDWGATVGGVSAGAFWLIKTIRNRAIKAITHGSDRTTEITLDDNEKIRVSEQTLKVYLDVEYRISIEKIIKPLQEPGIDSFEIRNPEKPEDKEPIVRVEKGESPYFAAPPSSDVAVDPLESRESEMLARIIYANFDEGKWKLHNGESAFWADIQDEEFVRRVETREVAFAKGDMLRIQYFTRQIVKEGKLSTDYIVTKVNEIYQKPTQVKLDFQYNQKS